MAAKKKSSGAKKTHTVVKYRQHPARKMGAAPVRRHKRKIGASPISESLMFGLIGGVAAKIVAKNIAGTTLGIPTNIQPFVTPAIGAGLMFMAKNKKAKEIGTGMLVVGVADYVGGMVPAFLHGVPQTVGVTYYPNKGQNRLPPQTVGRNQRTMRLNGVNPTKGAGGNRGTQIPMTIGNLYGSM